MNGNQYGKFFSKGFGNFNKTFSKFSKNLNKSKYQYNFINANLNLNKFSISLFNNMNFHMVNSFTKLNINSSNFALQKINSNESELSQDNPMNGNERNDVEISNNNLNEMIQNLKGKLIIFLLIELINLKSSALEMDVSVRASKDPGVSNCHRA